MDQGLKQKTVIKLLGKNLEENLQWAKSSQTLHQKMAQNLINH